MPRSPCASLLLAPPGCRRLAPAPLFKSSAHALARPTPRPPQLLGFHCAAGEGNNSLTDGFAVAYALKERFPKYFDLLSQHGMVRRLFAALRLARCAAHVARVAMPLCGGCCRDAADAMRVSSSTMRAMPCVVINEARFVA